MLMALTMWLMGLAGVAPSEADFLRYGREFRERGHHLLVDFGGQRTGGTRWSNDPAYIKRASIGLGYAYLVDRPYNGVGLEVLGQSLGSLLNADHDVNAFFIGAGLSYYPVRNVRVFTQAGPEIGLNGDTHGVGRLGLGYRFMFFKMGMQPYAYVQTTTEGQFGWAIQFRFEY